jgi:hypothetical protein
MTEQLNGAPDSSSNLGSEPFPEMTGNANVLFVVTMNNPTESDPGVLS